MRWWKLQLFSHPPLAPLQISSCQPGKSRSGCVNPVGTHHRAPEWWGFCSTAACSAGDENLGRWEGATSTPDLGVCRGRGGVQGFPFALPLTQQRYHGCGAASITPSILRCSRKDFTSNIKCCPSLRLLKAGAEPIT